MCIHLLIINNKKISLKLHKYPNEIVSFTLNQNNKYKNNKIPTSAGYVSKFTTQISYYSSQQQKALQNNGTVQLTLNENS